MKQSLTQKFAVVKGEKIEVDGAVKNAVQHDRDEDRARKRRKYNEKVGFVEPEMVSLTAMFNATGYEVQSGVDVHTIVERKMLAEQLHKAIAELPDQKREIIELRYFGGMTIRAIAEKLGVATMTVNDREKSALKLLKAALEKFN